MRRVLRLTQLDPTEWHRWFAWRPVRCCDWFEQGEFPRDIPDEWVWFKWVWRRTREVDHRTIEYYVRWKK